MYIKVETRWRQECNKPPTHPPAASRLPVHPNLVSPVSLPLFWSKFPASHHFIHKHLCMYLQKIWILYANTTKILLHPKGNYNYLISNILSVFKFLQIYQKIFFGTFPKRIRQLIDKCCLFKSKTSFPSSFFPCNLLVKAIGSFVIEIVLQSDFYLMLWFITCPSVPIISCEFRVRSRDLIKLIFDFWIEESITPVLCAEQPLRISV